MKIKNQKFKITHSRNSQLGNALISVIFFAFISITISTAAIIIISNSMLSSSKIQSGAEAYSLAESGAENAVLRLLRNPSYTGGETLTLDNGQAIATVSGSEPYVITSQGRSGNFVRTVQVQLGYNDQYVLSIQSWKEITP